MIATIAAAVGLFAATNIDDIVVLTVLFLASTRGSLPGWTVVVGQYLGFIALVAISVVAAAGLTIVPDEWVGFLGLIPLAIGLFGLIRTVRRRGDNDDDDSAIGAVGLLGVAGITIANGADNIALYTPVFRTQPIPDTVITIVVFLVLVAVWCLVARVVGTHGAVTEALEKIEHWLVPAVFIGLGLYILIESGVIVRFIEVIA
jgi:cadmium resistance transport/sequestration family protein